MTVPAPPRFSTTTGWPHTSDIRCARRRPTMSVAPPGGNGTISLTARSGNFCAQAARGCISPEAPATPKAKPDNTRRRAAAGRSARTGCFLVGDLEIGDAARCDRVVGVELLEVVSRL